MPGPADLTPADPTTASAYADRPWLASYPAGVPADYDFPVVPLTRLLDDAAASWPTRTALAFFGSRTTYRELKDAVDRFATALAGLGVRKGDRVALVLPNCPQNVIATFATLRLGAVVVQHNPLYTEPELRHQLADCGATVVVCLDRVYETVARVRRDTSVQHVVVTSMADYLSTGEKLALRLPLTRSKRQRAELTAAVPQGAPVRSFVALLRTAGAPAPQAPVDPVQDVALLQYTGGTTGVSKGAMLTHHNLVSNAYMNRLWDTGATPGREVCLAVLPLFHAYGLTVCMNATLLLGGTLVLLPRFDLDRVFAAIEQWKPTMLPGVPPLYKAISDSPRARTADLSSLRACVSGAMRLLPEIAEQFERVTGARLVEGYGLTETSPSTHCTPLSGPRKTGSIGLPLPGTHCKVVDPTDSSREVPPGEPGELAVRGPQVFAGYWRRDDLDSAFTEDGFLLTGDVVAMDDEGFFTVVDRKKELIIAGGFNIYPSEVEEVLAGLPGVREAAVVGVPDRYRGETVKAFVVREPGSALSEQDVVAHCAGQLTPYKVPRLVEFREQLPRSDVGKLLRRVLVEEERARQVPEEPPASLPGTVAARRRSAGVTEASTTSPTAAASRKRTTGGASPRKGTTTDKSGQNGRSPAEPRAGTPLEPEATAPTEDARQDRAPRKAGPRRTAARATAPGQAAPAKAGPRKAAPAKAGPVKTVPGKAGSAKAGVAGAAPVEVVPDRPADAAAPAVDAPASSGGAPSTGAPATPGAARTAPVRVRPPASARRGPGAATPPAPGAARPTARRPAPPDGGPE